MGLTNHGCISTASNQYFDQFGNPLDYYAINRHSANRGIPGIVHSKKIYEGKSQEEQQQLKATFGLLWEIAKEETKNAMLKWEGNVEEIVRK